MPKVRRDPNYLAQHKMVMLPDGGLQQLAGPHSALGHLMFHMKNRFDVYLHDTPSKNLFNRDDRRFSHGCIRVEDPRELAALLMQRPIEAIDEAIATGNTTRASSAEARAGIRGLRDRVRGCRWQLQFRADIYSRDAEIGQALDPKAANGGRPQDSRFDRESGG